MKSNRLGKALLIFILLGALLFLAACQEQTMDVASYQRDLGHTEQVETGLNRTKLASDNSLQNVESAERKIIRQGTLRLESRNWEHISAEISSLIEKYEGYISNSREWEDQNKRKFLNYTLRVPEQNFDSILEELKNLGQLQEQQANSQDITMEYLDLEMRLDNYREQEIRYRELLEQAESVEDILKIENELNRVRREVESLEGRIRYYDNRVNLSTINLHISQPAAIVSPGWGFLDSFKDAISSFARSINDIIVLIGTLLPWISLILFIFLILKFVKSRKD